jgi:hypothetical protein
MNTRVSAKRLYGKKIPEHVGWERGRFGTVTEVKSGACGVAVMG